MRCMDDRGFAGQMPGAAVIIVKPGFGAIVASRGLWAEYTIAPFDHIQIDFKNPPFAHNLFRHQRDYGFLRFTPRRALTRQKKVFSELID